MRRRRALGVTGLMCAAMLLTAPSVDAQVVHLRATLSGSNEVPARVLTGAHGAAEVSVNLQTQTVTYDVRVFNLPTGTTGGHFHVGGHGLAGPVVVNLAPPPGATGDYQLSGTLGPSTLVPRAAQGILTWTDFLQSLVAGETYVNIHSTANPGGEIRGQVLYLREEN